MDSPKPPTHCSLSTSTNSAQTLAQGAATAVWSATSPLSHGYGGAYCQGCDIAEAARDNDMLTGVVGLAGSPARYR